MSLRLFLFHTCNGSGPFPPPFLDFAFIDLGADACWPLAVFATSRGRGAGGTVVPGVIACGVATHVS